MSKKQKHNRSWYQVHIWKLTEPWCLSVLSGRIPLLAALLAVIWFLYPTVQEWRGQQTLLPDPCRRRSGPCPRLTGWEITCVPFGQSHPSGTSNPQTDVEQIVVLCFPHRPAATQLKADHLNLAHECRANKITTF